MGKGLYSVRVICTGDTIVEIEAENEEEAMDIAEREVERSGPDYWDTQSDDVECLRYPTTKEEDILLRVAEEDAKRQLPLF